ncbi:MAG: LytTR family DNA-binding domain-containing protein [Chryseolinea sp.]
MTYSVVIIEDEKHQQEMLSHLLEEDFPELKVIGIASSIPESIQMLASTKPDLVFMDVLLPPDTSFDLLNSLQNIPFEIIFTTSFEEYAVKAFRLSAVDYLVKPVVRAELKLAVDKFKQKKSMKDTSIHIQTLLENIQVTKAEHTKIALPTLTGFIFVTVKDIIRCESDNTYTTFFTTDKRKIIVSKTLKDCEQMLSDYRFYRVHNSHLINLEYIAEYTKGEGGIVKMLDGSQIDVSRRRKEEFLHVLKRS